MNILPSLISSHHYQSPAVLASVNSVNSYFDIKTASTMAASTSTPNLTAVTLCTTVLESLK